MVQIGLPMENLPGRYRPENEQPKPTEHPNQPEPQRAPHEGGNDVPGLPPTLHERAKPPPKSQERQPLPSVWDVLEGQVRIHEEFSSHLITYQEYDRERRKLI